MTEKNCAPWMGFALSWQELVALQHVHVPQGLPQAAGP